MASLARNVLLRMSKSSWLADKVMTRQFAKRAVKRFMPGEEVSDALDAAQELAPVKIGAVLTKLGENLTAEAEAHAVRDHYLDVFDQIKTRQLDAHVSVKPTQLGLDFSQAHCADHLGLLAQKARRWAPISGSTWRTRATSTDLELYRGLRPSMRRSAWPQASCAAARRSPAVVGSPAHRPPREGRYAEPPHVAFPAKRDVDLAYYDLAVELLNAATKGQALPIFGTHDMGLVERLVSKASSLGLENTATRFTCCNGIRMTDQKALAAKGRTVKTLISYGSLVSGTCVGRLSARPTSGSWRKACSPVRDPGIRGATSFW
jgi:proline dehydrogenase